VAARVAPLGGIAAESMRQATRRAEQHIARLLAKVRRSGRLGAARHMIAGEGLAAVGAMIARYRDEPGSPRTSGRDQAMLGRIPHLSRASCRTTTWVHWLNQQGK
jgi:hypothetical protein